MQPGATARTGERPAIAASARIFGRRNQKDGHVSIAAFRTFADGRHFGSADLS
jgi:hypothetical protein